MDKSTNLRQVHAVEKVPPSPEVYGHGQPDAGEVEHVEAAVSADTQENPQEATKVSSPQPCYRPEATPFNRKRPPLRITPAVLAEIESTVGCLPAEHGGVLGGSYSDCIVAHYYFDRSARCTGATYSPNHQLVNRLLKNEWNPREIRLLGFVHSHPPGMAQPSGGDLVYAHDILESIPDLEQLLLPIVLTRPDTGQFSVRAWAVLRDGRRVRLQDMELAVTDGEPLTAHGEGANVEVDVQERTSRAGGRSRERQDVQKQAAKIIHDRHDRGTPADTTYTFLRVRSAYDLDRLARCRIVCAGTGGAAGFIEDLARAGVGEHVLIDGDVVSETNLATQQVYRRDLGRSKVESIAERILDINPNAQVVARPQPLEAIDDTEFGHLASAPLDGKAPILTVVCGFTDSFYAQARVNRLALQLGLPSLCAQVYREGRGAEITFAYPGVTPACHRCILSSRYDAYLEQGFQNDVTSDGTPIFATSRLNALKGFIAMAILHHGSGHPRWGGLLQRVGNRNLVQIRMDPDLQSTLGLKVFDRVFGAGDMTRILFDEAVWLPQEPERPELTGRPPCPECGGTGDLRDAMGTFADTRIMPSTEVSHAPVHLRQ